MHLESVSLRHLSLPGTRRANFCTAHVSLLVGCPGSDVVFTFSDSCSVCSSLPHSISSPLTSSSSFNATMPLLSSIVVRVLCSCLLPVSGLQGHHQSNSPLPHSIQTLPCPCLSCQDPPPHVQDEHGISLHVENARLILCEHHIVSLFLQFVNTDQRARHRPCVEYSLSRST